VKLSDSFENAKIKANIYLQDNERLSNLQVSLNEKIEKSKEKISESLNDIYTLMRLLAAYSTGEYREIAFKSMVVIVAALIYFLSPLDVVPDFVATVGFLDDLAILTYVFKTFKDEINRFIDWEMEGKDLLDEKDLKNDEE